MDTVDGAKWVLGFTIEHKYIYTYILLEIQCEVCCTYHLTKTFHNGSAPPISEILHIKNWLICCIEIYLVPIFTYQLIQ